MKYDKQQYQILVKALKILKEKTPLLDMGLNPSTIHYTVYQQFSKGQTHNHLYITNNNILSKFYGLTTEQKMTAKKVINFNDFDFKLYPNGCNDKHIETAIKKALKEL